MLENNLGLIQKIVWSFVHSNPGLEFDDLFQEACVAYLEALPKYDPNRGKETTFVWHTVHNHLKTLVTRNAPITMELLETAEISSEANPEQELIAKESWGEFMGGLSQEAKAICQLTLGEMGETLPIETPKKARGMIVNRLREDGWSWGSIWGSFKEIKLALNEI